MAEKLTTMKLKVDLQCEKCYKKVKKVLCKFPQIRDQSYDEKKNTVTIKVVCCSPDKMSDKLCYKGGGSIRSIEIVEQQKPAPQKEAQLPKEKAGKKPEPKAEPPAKPEPKKEPPAKPKSGVVPPQGEPPRSGGVAAPPSAQPAAIFPEPMPVSVLAYPAPAQPVGLFYHGGPTGFYGRPIYDSYGGGGPSYGCSHNQNPWEEEESGCTIT